MTKLAWLATDLPGRVRILAGLARLAGLHFAWPLLIQFRAQVFPALALHQDGPFADMDTSAAHRVVLYDYDTPSHYDYQRVHEVLNRVPGHRFRWVDGLAGGICRWQQEGLILGMELARLQ